MSEDGGQTWTIQPTDGQLFINKIVRTTGIAWAVGPFGMLKQTGAGLEWKKILNPLASAAAADDGPTFTAPVK